MGMYVSKVPGFFWRLFPGVVGQVPTKENTLFLTFDDGPTPGVTDAVLDMLDKHNAKATFFCIGKNVAAHPDLYAEVVKRGHTVGNHTHNHLNGWDTDDETYFDNIDQCAQLVESDLFRPPYGKITLSQMGYLRRNYKIMMWDVLSGDFDPELKPETCLGNVLRHAGKGSIIVMHDSVKAAPKVEYVLPRVLKHYAERGFEFHGLNF